MNSNQHLFNLLLIASLPILIVAQDHPDWDTKIDKELQQDLIAGKTVHVVCTFTSTSKILQDTVKNHGPETHAEELADYFWQNSDALRVRDTNNLINALRELEFSDKYKVIYVTLWVTNRLSITNCNLKVANIVLKEGPNLVKMEPDLKYPIKLLQNKEVTKGEGPTDLSWGLKKIEIEKAWDLVGGAKEAGAGARVGIMDTGIDGRSKFIYRKWNDGYGYLDPSVPTRRWVDKKNSSSHGTHITGTIVGDKGIGVAPGAEFIFCEACRSDHLCPQSYIESCAQHFFCPSSYKSGGEGCGRLVDVVHMSFGFSDSTPPPWFDLIMEAFKVIKIVTVIAAGNGDQKCKSITFPATLNDVLTVGSTNEDDSVSEFTSFGPVDGGGIIKPDFVAPGSNIVSAGHKKQFEFGLNGDTSSAAAHVTGLILLLRGIDKHLPFETIRKLVSENTDFVHPRNGLKCEDKTDEDKPNYSYGHGRINVFKTVTALKNGPHITSRSLIKPNTRSGSSNATKESIFKFDEKVSYTSG